jgi:hypothetical protein
MLFSISLLIGCYVFRFNCHQQWADTTLPSVCLSVCLSNCVRSLYKSPSNLTRDVRYILVHLVFRVLQAVFCSTMSLAVSVDCVLNVMAHAQKPDFVFRRNGRVNLNRQGRQFSRLMAAEVCALAVVMLDIPCSEVVWRVLATHSIRQFPLHFPSRASPCAIRSNWTIPKEAGRSETVRELWLKTMQAMYV